MATQASTVTPGTAVKKAGPPVPPRPTHTSAAAAASLLKPQRDTSTTRITTQTATTSFTNSKVTVANVITEQPQSHTHPHPVIQKKPTLIGANAAAAAAAAVAGRTVIYKSPSMKPTQQNDATSLSRSPAHSTAATRDATVAAPTAAAKSTTTRPPLKLRKAPDVPNAAKPKAPPPVKRESIGDSGDNRNKSLDGASNDKAITNLSTEAGGDAQLRNNIVVVQSPTNGAAVNLSRHHSMGSPKTQQSVQLKDTRFSLGRADFEQIQGKIQLDQLPASAQPLPRPRKIVKVPVATLDLEEQNGGASQQTNSSGVSLFRRSKTTLDNFASRANITTISTGGVSNSFLGGKTAELKNNLKNAAERLFSEIIVSQQKHAMESPTITKHERAHQHQAVLEQEQESEHQLQLRGVDSTVTVVTRADATLNCTRINVNASAEQSSTNVGASIQNSSQHTPIAGQARDAAKIENILSSPEKKTAFHEILISELAAMRGRFSSMENLSTSVQQSASTTTLVASSGTNSSTAITKSATLATLVQPSGNIKNSSDSKNDAQFNSNANKNNNNTDSNKSSANRDSSQLRKRCSSVEDHDPDTEDVDADNVEDTEGDDDVVQKRRKSHNNAGTPRKRCPSGCSSDSSPYGTERSARIRTSDWIEVGDNGKAVTMTSCHISLEDSGLEDEERLDEMSSSGVGDSWDSVKEAENVKRCRSVKRIMSISDLPPLPKSLSGINKMLGSDSGLISDDADANADNQHLQHLTHHHHHNSTSTSTSNTNTNNHNNITASASNNKNNNNNSNINNINAFYQKEDSNNNNNKNRNSNNNQNNNKSNESNEIIEKLQSNGSELEVKTIQATTAITTPPTATATATAAAAETITQTTTAASTADMTTATTPTKQQTATKNNAAANAMTTTSVTGSTLDTQLAILRKEMYGLRQLDLSLLSQLWALNDSIQEFRTMLEEQEVQDGEPDSYSPHSPTPSSYDSVSSDGEDDTTTISNHGNMNMKKLRTAEATPKIITTQPKLTKSNSVSDNTHRKSVTSTASSVASATAMLPPQRPSPPKALDARPLPRMRSAPPPPPINRKSAAPPRPT